LVDYLVSLVICDTGNADDADADEPCGSQTLQGPQGVYEAV
jgi:hypothetical protein